MRGNEEREGTQENETVSTFIAIPTVIGVPDELVRRKVQVVDKECGLGDDAGGWFLTG